ncbi:MAG TPA: hypothetical protein VEU62_22760 [Bryobacterales bacterium]|nr:hypothetical protein [Bryobacterales bacterium]
MAQRRRQNRKSEVRPAARAAAALPTPPLVPRKEKFIWAGALLAVYALIATWGQFDFRDLMGYYNLQADAFLAGHLYIAPTPAQGYLQDMIPFEGHYYLQWGPFPAVLHVAAKLAGASLSDRAACLLAGWLTALVFLATVLGLQRTYFPAAPKWICRWVFFAFALGTPAVIVALRGTIYHESIAWAALFVMAAFWAFLAYAEKPSPGRALLCGAAIGLALLSRVTQGLYAAGLLAGMAALLWQAKQPLKRALAHLAAFAVPVGASVLLMLAYNQARFHSPWDYGLQYLPTPYANLRPFALDRVWENFRHYALAPIHFRHELPWMNHEGWQPLVHTAQAEDMSSLLLASPFLMLGALAWRVLRKRDEFPAALRIFTLTAAGSALLVFFALLCYFWAARRYMQDFVPALMIVAFIGAAARAKPGASWRRWQWPARVILLVAAAIELQILFFQPMFHPPDDPNQMETFVAWSPLLRRIAPGKKLDEEDVISHNELGIQCLGEHRYAEAVRHFERAAELAPDSTLIPQNLRLARQLAAQARSQAQ